MPKIGKMAKKFSDFRVRKETLQLLSDRKLEYMFPIQQATYDYIYDGMDVMGRAHTGTGKTLAFALPLVETIMEEEGPCHIK